MGTIFSILFAIFIFSFLIFIHELGHFVCAKLSGVQVNEFAMFMGPAIWKKQKGETLYSIRCIPLGGYCAMEGEDGDSDNPRSFQKAKWWKRLVILVAGAFMNFVAGLLLFAIFFGFRPDYQELPQTTISRFESCSSLYGEDKLLPGDRILEIDGETVYVMSDFSLILSINGDQQTHDFLVERKGREVMIRDMVVQPHTHEEADGSQYTHYGIAFDTKDRNLFTTLEFAWLNSVDNIRNVRLSLQMLFTGKAGLSDMSGPVGIVDQMSQVASASQSIGLAILNLLYFGAFIAVNLAVMNLLPIPALDGGRAVALLLTAAIEGITRKKINPKYEGYIHAGGMILLLLLMAFIMFKDVIWLFK